MNLSDRPEHRARQRAALDDAMFPDWTARANCARIKVLSGTGGQLADDFFKDELSTRKAEDDEWPSRVVTAMRVCSDCPVRAECLRWAMESETRLSQEWKTGELVEQDRRFGVYGGVPGRIRERFGTMPCPVCGGSGVEPGGFDQPPLGMDTKEWTKTFWQVLGPLIHKDKKGWPCTHCKKSGRVPRPDRIERCEQWAADYAERRGWAADDRQEGAA